MARDDFSGIDYESYQDGYRDGRLDAIERCINIVRSITVDARMLQALATIRDEYEDDHPGVPGPRRKA